MKGFEEFDSMDELKQAIAHLTNKYESLRHVERAGKLAEAREIVETYQISAEELGLRLSSPRIEAATEKRASKRTTPEDQAPQQAKSHQQPLW